MRPRDIQQVNDLLAVVWEDGHESFFPLEYLRRHCPCANCKGETVGNQHFRPEPQRFTALSFQLRAVEPVGGYAVRPIWNDGHATGLFAFDYLRRLCPCEACGGEKNS
jgi:DUF971 family protein